VSAERESGPQAIGSGSPRFLADADFNSRVISGLRRREPMVDVVTAHEADLRDAPDPEVLRYAMRHDRILLTHDVNTMPTHFYVLLQSLAEGEHSPGVLATPQLLPIGSAIDALLLVWSCSAHEEWRDRVEFLPL
jgi:hypothetical protein